MTAKANSPLPGSPILDIQVELLDSLDLGKAPTVLDVGANTGAFTDEVLDRWPDARVICFEPNPNAADLITKQAEVRTVGLSSDTHEAWLYHNPGGTDMTASLYRRYDWPDHGAVVLMDRLDDQLGLPDVIDFMKVDAEGEELHVLRGAGELLYPNIIRYVQWEFNDAQVDAHVFFKDFWDLLVPRGYKIGNLLRGGQVAFYPEYSSRCEDFTAHRELLAVEA